MTTDREALVKRIQDAIRCAQDETGPALILSAKSCRELLAALSAPDEALIEEIAEQAMRVCNKYAAATYAIREYIRRSAGKEKG